MDIPYYLALPMAAALMYAFGSLFFKRSLEHGITVLHALVVTNWCMMAVFVPFLLLDPGSHSWIELLQPLACALLFFLGNWLTFVALRRGDMSLVVPAMGTKPLFVALGAVAFFGRSVSQGMWLAAILAALGIYVLRRSDILPGRNRASGLPPVLLSSACFGFCDAGVEAWAPEFGDMGFLGYMFLIVALLSTLLLRLSGQSLMRADRSGMKALAIGSSILAAQGILVALAIVRHQNATGVNIVYSTRGLWSVAVVWLLGSRFRLGEEASDRSVFLFRLAGAGLMIVSVALAALESAAG